MFSILHLRRLSKVVFPQVWLSKSARVTSSLVFYFLTTLLGWERERAVFQDFEANHNSNIIMKRWANIVSTCLIFLKILGLKHPVITTKIIHFPEKVTITINVWWKTSREEAWIPILLLTCIYVVLQLFVFSLPGFVRLQLLRFWLSTSCFVFDNLIVFSLFIRLFLFSTLPGMPPPIA